MSVYIWYTICYTYGIQMVYNNHYLVITNNAEIFPTLLSGNMMDEHSYYEFSVTCLIQVRFKSLEQCNYQVNLSYIHCISIIIYINMKHNGYDVCINFIDFD